MIKTYINKFIENLPDEIKDYAKNKTPMKIDLVLDGGTFNGSYLVGALYFIKEMEARNYIKVERISGCSIGSIVGLLYLIDALDEFASLYESLLLHFKREQNFNFIKSLKTKLLHYIPNNICEKVFKKFYVTFHNIKTGKKIVKNVYKNIDEIFDSVKKSCYVPFLIDGNLLYQNKYIDGLNPFFFKYKKNRRILFMDLWGLDKIGCILNVKNEKTNFHRVLSGMLDIHNFFIKGSQTQMCSYVDNWGLYNYVFINIRYLIEKIIVYQVYFLDIINKNLSKNFKQGMMCRLMAKIGSEILVMLIHDDMYYTPLKNSTKLHRPNRDYYWVQHPLFPLF